jgi:hypothetical protein
LDSAVILTEAALEVSVSKPFGEDLWRNVKSVRIDKDGTFHAPVRADGVDGIVVGVDAVEDLPPRPRTKRRGVLRRILRRRSR